jgi:hypothetical protein
MAQYLPSSRQTFSQFIRHMSLLSYTSKTKTDCIQNFIEQQLKQNGLNCNDSSFQVLGAFGNLSFRKFRRCIHESELSHWKSCSNKSLDSICGTNEQPTNGPNSEPTKQTELPNILTSKRGKYSLSEKQDAEPPSKITVLITQFTSNTSYKFEAVNGINTSYTCAAVNGVNAKPFEAVNGINTSYMFEAVNGVNAKPFEAAMASTPLIRLRQSMVSMRMHHNLQLLRLLRETRFLREHKLFHSC